jgi:hypothetical protein
MNNNIKCKLNILKSKTMQTPELGEFRKSTEISDARNLFKHLFQTTQNRI